MQPVELICEECGKKIRTTQRRGKCPACAGLTTTRNRRQHHFRDAGRSFLHAALLLVIGSLPGSLLLAAIICFAAAVHTGNGWFYVGLLLCLVGLPVARWVTRFLLARIDRLES